jgi:hypothetical protein
MYRPPQIRNSFTDEETSAETGSANRAQRETLAHSIHGS